MIKAQLSLDLMRKNITPRIFAKQIDSGRNIEFTVYCDGVLCSDIFDETRVLTSKGESSFYCSSLAEESVIQNLTNGKTIWKMPSEVLGVPGITMGELQLLKGDDLVSSMPFEIYVEKSAAKRDAIIPKNTIDFIIRAENAAKQAEQASKSAAECRNDVETKLANGDYNGDVGPQGPQGVSGVYLGSGEMPDGYNVQVDLDGETIEVYTKRETDNLLLDKIRFWQPNTEYKVGDKCYYHSLDSAYSGKSIFLECTSDHISGEALILDMSYWIEFKIMVDKSINDADGNVIHETYATKEEVVGTLGTINEVLAALVDVERKEE